MDDWVVYPFLFHIGKRDKIQLDWEHTEFRWIKPSDLKEYDTVPRFKEIVKIAENTEILIVTQIPLSIGPTRNSVFEAIASSS